VKGKQNFKVFGASLDVLDIQDVIQLKIAYLNSLIKDIKLSPNFLDPYDALTTKISKFLKEKSITLNGKFYIDSQFTPKPKIHNLFKINQENYISFLESNGCKRYASALGEYVENFIFPKKPFMIGVDHSLSGGVISSLCKKYGKENLTIVILDSHFDAIPSSIRKSCGEIFYKTLSDNIYTCGNFISLLIKEKKILPENLIMIGVTDYPKCNFLKNENFKKFTKYYLSFEKKGVKFITKKEIKKNKLYEVLSNIKTKYVYLSLDVDVCANNGIYAVRFLDRIGISENNLYEIAKRINFFINSNNFELVGLDIMEINIHFLGLKIKNGIKDRTLNICKNYLKNLFL
jgi:arginase family enzyme